MTNMALYMKNRREERRNHLITLAGGYCKCCGSTESLQFDHRDPTSKLFELCGPELDKSMELIMIEFAKCDLLCAICHLSKTLRNKETIVNRTPAQPFIHGTARTYLKQGCRCVICSNARKMHRAGKLEFNQPINC
jgi:hypothetical protein